MVSGPAGESRSSPAGEFRTIIETHGGDMPTTRLASAAGSPIAARTSAPARHSCRTIPVHVLPAIAIEVAAKGGA